MTKIKAIVKHNPKSLVEDVFPAQDGVSSQELAAIICPEVLPAFFCDLPSGPPANNHLQLAMKHHQRLLAITLYSARNSWDFEEREGPKTEFEWSGGVKTLLECDIPIHYNVEIGSAASKAPYETQMLLVRHLVDRRCRLRDLALKLLPSYEISRLGLSSERIVDRTANEVIRALENQGFDIPHALTISSSSEGSVYRHTYSPTLAGILLQAGFTEIDIAEGLLSVEPFLQGRSYDFLLDAFEECAYLSWLLKNTATAWSIGNAVPNELCATFLDSMGLDGDHNVLHIVAFLMGRLQMFRRSRLKVTLMTFKRTPPPNEIFIGRTDNCVCGCSSGGCLPFTSYMYSVTAACKENFLDAFPEIFSDLNRNSDLRKREILEYIRFYTFTKLECRHTCCSETLWTRLKAYRWSSLLWPSKGPDPEEQDHQEIREEDHHQLVLLDFLMDEFEAELLSMADSRQNNLLSDFMLRYWEPRMTEVLNSRKLQAEDLAVIKEIGVDLEVRESSDTDSISMRDSDASSVSSFDLAETSEEHETRRYAAVGRAIDRICGWNDFGGQEKLQKRVRRPKLRLHRKSSASSAK